MGLFEFYDDRPGFSLLHLDAYRKNIILYLYKTLPFFSICYPLLSCPFCKSGRVGEQVGGV